MSMSEPVELLKFNGKYPIQMKRELLGYDQNMENDCYEQRIYMYLGNIRLDITNLMPLEVKRIVRNLELMNLTGEM
jgi:hypothetical protein